MEQSPQPVGQENQANAIVLMITNFHILGLKEYILPSKLIPELLMSNINVNLECLSYALENNIMRKSISLLCPHRVLFKRGFKHKVWKHAIQVIENVYPFPAKKINDS